MAFDTTSPNHPSQAGEAAMNAILENFLQLRKHEAATTAPASPVANMPWPDLTTNLMKQRNTANTAWITLWELDKHYPSFPSGTKMIFVQAAAPTGWTKDTTYNGYMLHIVTDGTGGSTGGSDNPVSHNHTTSGHTLIASEIAYHSHPMPTEIEKVSGPSALRIDTSSGAHEPWSTNNQSSGGGSHTHGNTGTFSPKYYNGIVCTKD
jgi:hypothetical protein